MTVTFTTFPRLALTTEPCAFKSGVCLWFPPPTVQGRAWRSLAELLSFEHVCAGVVRSDWSEGLLIQSAFRVTCRPGASAAFGSRGLDVPFLGGSWSSRVLLAASLGR